MELALAILALLLSLPALVFSILSYIEVKATKLSTHSVQWEPFEMSESPGPMSVPNAPFPNFPADSSNPTELDELYMQGKFSGPGGDGL